MIRVGIIGAGFFGTMHAQAIARVPSIRLVAASRTTRSALDEFSRRFQVRGYSNYRDLLADEEIDAVVIATPHYLHTDVALDAAKAGKHMLLEKPMAPTLDECDRILQAVKQAQVKLMIGHVYHFVHAYEVAQKLIRSGEMGDVVSGISTMSKFWFEPNRRPWHLDRATGGGMWLTAGMHCLDRLTWLVGCPAVSVAAQFSTRFHDQQADDAGLIFVRYANGASGAVVSTGYRTGAPKHLTELTCAKGTMNIDHSAGVTIGRDETWQLVPDSLSANWHHDALVKEWTAFANYVESESESPVSGDYGRHIMATVLAAEESSSRRCEMPVPPTPWTGSK